MFMTLASLLLASLPPQASVAQPPPDDDCAALRRLEVSPPLLSSPRICVSPGILTGLMFNQPVDVDLQEEVRFAQVIRGRDGIVFIPPRDLLPGELLRVSAVLGTGEARQSLTFVLVAHPGQGSHQVDVIYTEPVRQALSDALGQALLVNKQLAEGMAALAAEMTRTRVQLESFAGLCGAYGGGQLSQEGIRARILVVPRDPLGALAATDAVSYRGDSNIAVEVTLINRTQEPWSLELEKVVLVNSRGETLKALRFRQSGALLPGEKLPVFVEFDPKGFALEGATLTLADAAGRALSLPDVFFP